MKALLYDDKLQYDPDYPEPLTPGEANLRVTTAGICNTDLEITKGYMGFSGVLGHEFVGVVESAPDPDLVGKRVVGEINCGRCGRCLHCRRGLFIHCAHRTVLGIQNRDGAFAETTTLPVENLHVVPDRVPDEAAVFTEPLAAALQIREQIRVRPDSHAIVIGDGKLGLLIAQVMALAGTRTTLVGHHQKNLDLADSWGVATCLTRGDEMPEIEKADTVVEVTGSAGGLANAIALTNPRGTLVLKSTVAGETTANLAPVVIDEIAIVGSRCGPFAPALRLLERGAIDTKSLIDKEFPLEKGLAAFKKAAGKGTKKVLLRVG